MNKTYLFITIYLISITLFISCEWDLIETEVSECPCGEPIIDERDGQEYETVWIDVDGGSDLTKTGRCWMKERLRYNLNEVGTTIDIDTITHEHIDKNKTPLVFYDCEEVLNKSICPRGWRVPSDSNFLALELKWTTPEQISDLHTFITDIGVRIRDTNNAGGGPAGKFANLFDIDFPGYIKSNKEILQGGKRFYFWSNSSSRYPQADHPIYRIVRRDRSPSTNGISRLPEKICQSYCVICIKNPD